MQIVFFLFISWIALPFEFMELVKHNDMEGIGENFKISKWDSLSFPKKVMDYCHLFHENLDYKQFKDFSYTQAYERGSVVVETLDVPNAFFAFHTANTPPEMDGDSEEEWDYEIKYWDLANGKRFIALTKTLVTWVSEETISVSFYLQEGTTMEKVNWKGFSWNLGDFIGQEVGSYFDEEIWEHPPVVVELPQEGAHLIVSLAFHEYMQNRKSFEVYDSLQLQIKEKKLLFDAVKQN